MNNFSSYELYKYVSLNIKTNKQTIEKLSDEILSKCISEYNLFDFLTILTMKFHDVDKAKCDIILENSLKKVFNKNTILCLLKLYKKISLKEDISYNEVFNVLIDDVLKNDSEKISIIIFDLTIFNDFNEILTKLHPLVAFMIESYKLFDPNVVSSKIFLGSSIIGKLLDGDNEKIAEKYVKKILHDNQISRHNFKMIGGGGSSLVFKVGDLVLKLGETRHNRKVYINHRILASLVRKLELSEDLKELFYVEIMRYALVGDVTKEERDELKKDLYDQGLIWYDDKLENCGVLQDDDLNESPMSVDYVEIAGRIDNPDRREQFMKRKRRVVVIDNDCIRFNPFISSN